MSRDLEVMCYKNTRPTFGQLDQTFFQYVIGDFKEIEISLIPDDCSFETNPDYLPHSEDHPTEEYRHRSTRHEPEISCYVAHR